MRGRVIQAFILSLVFGASVRADAVIYAYEGDVLPYDAFAGWELFNPCEPPCVESLEDGSFVLRWPVAGDLADYAYRIADPGETPPESLWVEWRFASNHPLPVHSFTCDALFKVDFRDVLEIVLLYGDAVVSFSGDDFLLGLEIGVFHTLRFESPDGLSFRFSVDGTVFFAGDGIGGDDFHNLQMAGRGGCIDDQIPDAFNRWDYVRYGELGSDEQVIATNPPQGYLDPDVYAGIDRFTITFNAPNYLYVGDITVEVSAGDVPQVIATARGDTDGPATLEITLDRPMPIGETITFTIDTGSGPQTISYTLAVEIPATSTWGLIVLTLGCLTAGGVILNRSDREAKPHERAVE